MNKNRIVMFISGLIIFVGTIFFTYDIVITNILSSYYCSQEPNPKSFIKKKIEKPISIYWEDNVYPGFNKEDRELMIINYLDGVHLKTMALNGDDGNVYIYSAKKDDYERMVSQSTYPKAKYERYKEYVSFIMKSEEIYTKENMPKMNYTVISNEVNLNSFARKFLYSDETKIIDNQTNEIVGYNKRFMRFFYTLFPDVALGNIYYYPHSVCGRESNRKLEDITFIGLNYHYYKAGTLGLNQKLYKKYIKGEK